MEDEADSGMRTSYYIIKTIDEFQVMRLEFGKTRREQVKDNCREQKYLAAQMAPKPLQINDFSLLRNKVDDFG